MKQVDGEKLLASLGEGIKEVRGRLTPDAPMDRVTWFRAGGLAELMFHPHDTEDLATFLKLVPEEVPITVTGVGSNLLVRDGGIPGVVIRLSAKGFGDVELVGENRIKAGANCPDKNIAAMALDHGIAGFEFYYGIPGSIGGALRMNAGANGGETKDVLVEARGVGRNGTKHVFDNAGMQFVYRNSGVDPSIIFTSATFRGPITDSDAIRVRMNEVQAHREMAQPIREKTGGSTFKNPPGHSAWKLVDAAGCRGLRVGGAQVSEMHCNFLINTGDATAADIEQLGETVRARVLAQSGIDLHWEIKRIGVAL